MAEIRQGYLDDYSQNSTGVGIGTSSPVDAKLEIVGGTTTQELNVTGIASFISASGFVKKHTDYTENVNINIGDSGTLSGEIVVGAGLTMIVGTGATASQGSVNSLKVSNMFQPPSGTTNQRPPAKTGALFYNFDFKTIEFFDGNSWRQVDNTTRRGRGVLGGRTSTPTHQQVIGFITMATRGNEQNFGELTESTQYPANGATSSSTRGLIGGGTASNPSPTFTNRIDFITIATTSNALDFGDLNNASRNIGGVSNSTRGLFAGGGDNPALIDVIDFVTIATLGDATDFGNCTDAKKGMSGVGSPTRGLFAGGYNPSHTDDIDLVTIASTGNATDFGNLTLARAFCGGVSSPTRGVWGGGGVPSAKSNVIDFVTIATTGNATDFGDLLDQRNPDNSQICSHLRGLFVGGENPGPSACNIIAHITIASTGDAADFGDIRTATSQSAGCSDSHGGLSE